MSPSQNLARAHQRPCAVAGDRMNREQGVELAQARAVAKTPAELLAPACQRIEIAGSIRRKKPNPNDIQLVAVPRIERQAQLRFLATGE